MIRKSLCRVQVLLVLIFSFEFTPAAVMEVLTIGELVKASHVIVIGRLSCIESQYNNDRTMIFTDVELISERYLKGPNEDNIVRFRMLGGTVENISTILVGAPTLMKDEETLLFLIDVEGGLLKNHLTITGLAQGKFKISINNSDERIVTRDLSNIAFIGDKNQLIRNGISLNTLIELIERELPKGGE